MKATLLIVAAACGLFTLANSTSAQGTAFTYQGRLNFGTNPANGTYDVEFTLFPQSSGGSAIAGPVVKTAIGVTNGLFTAMVDFGGVFPGATNWLELAVRTNGAPTFSPALVPRQQLTPTPYALYAETANASNLVGTVPAANLPGVALLAGGNAFTGNQSVLSGNMGIGTTSPQGTLELHNAGGRNLVLSGPGGAIWSFYDSTAGGFGWDISGNMDSFAISDSGVGYPLTILRPSGNVGIGTTTPGALLEVNGNALVDGEMKATGSSGAVSFLNRQNQNETWQWSADNSGAVFRNFGGNAGSPLQVSTNGYIGIGTSTPKHKLDVNGNLFFGTQGNGQIFAELSDTLYLGSSRKYLGNTLGAPVNGTTDWINLMAHPLSAGIMFGLSGPSDANPHSAPTPLMVIESSGNVGIGITNPAVTLDVNGNGHFGGLNVGSTNSGITTFSVIGSGGNGQLDIGIAAFPTAYSSSATADDAVIRQSGRGNLYLQTGTGAAAITINTNNNVGIGTPAPSTALQVNGTVRATAFTGDGSGLTNVTADSLSGPGLVPTQTNIYAANGVYSVTVPAGISNMVVKLWGAGGASGPYFSIPGGGGAYSSVTLNVTAGQTYTVVVGQAGSLRSSGDTTGGGGNGSGDGQGGGSLQDGGGGGQASSLFLFNGSTYIMKAVAGGGGGGGVNSSGGAGGNPGQDPSNTGLGGANGAGGGNGGNYSTKAANVGETALSLMGGSGGGGYAGNGGGGGGYGGGGGPQATSGPDAYAGGAGGGSYGTTIIGGSNNVPGNISDANYTSTNGYSGSDGLAVVIFSMPGLVTAASVSSTAPGTASLNGSFAGTFTGNGGSLSNLNPANLAGTVADTNLSANIALLNRAAQSFTGGTNSFSGSVGVGTTTPSTALQVVGTVTATAFSGSGSGLTSLGISNLTGAGTLPDTNLSANVALLNRAVQSFTGGTNSFSGSVGIGTTTPAKAFDVTGNASGVAGGASVDPAIFMRLNNSATDGSTGGPDYAGIGFGHNSTRQAIVGGTFGNDYLDFYTGGLLTTPKMRMDFNGSITLNDPRVGNTGSGSQITFNDYYSGSAESGIIDSIGNGGGFSWRNGALELRPVSRLNVYKGNDVTSASQVALTVIGSSGNVGIGTNNPSQALQVIGNILASGTVTGSSDRNVKTNFTAISPQDVLDKVAALPITRWNYDADLDVAHIGPMAQDFYAAFNVGMDDRHISMVDADGVALAAIQGLNQKVEQKDAKIKELETRLEKLERLINARSEGAK